MSAMTTDSLPSEKPKDGRARPPAGAVAVFLTIVLTIVVGVHAFIGLHLIGPIHPGALPPAARAAAWALLGLSALLVPAGLIGRFFLRGPAADRLAFVGLTLMGFVSFLLVGTALRDALLGAAGLFGLFGALGGGDGEALRADLLSGSSLLLLPLSAALTAVGYHSARRHPPVVDVEVRVPDLDPRLDGLRVVQISDIHVGPTIKGRHLKRVVDAVNALEADVVAITGDLVDGTVSELRDDVAPVAELRARHGVFFVTGNHEYYVGVEAWVAELRRLGLTVLRNGHRVVECPERGGARLVVAGVDDYSAARMQPGAQSDPAAAVAGAPVGLFRLLLAHQPRSVAAAAEAGVDLQLSGHTHGGQFVPWNLFVPLQQPFTHSLRTHGRTQIYTSRGTGYWGPPLRLGAPSEITRIVLRASYQTDNA